MFADQYTIHEHRKNYKFDMRKLKQAMRECGVSMVPDEEKAVALCTAIYELLSEALEKARTEALYDRDWDE